MNKEEALLANPPAEGFVRVFHPGLEDSVTDVSEASFDQVYKAKGWEKFQGSTAGSQPETAPAAKREGKGE